MIIVSQFWGFRSRILKTNEFKLLQKENEFLFKLYMATDIEWSLSKLGQANWSFLISRMWILENKAWKLTNLRETISLRNFIFLNYFSNGLMSVWIQVLSDHWKIIYVPEGLRSIHSWNFSVLPCAREALANREIPGRCIECMGAESTVFGNQI